MSLNYSGSIFIRIYFINALVMIFCKSTVAAIKCPLGEMIVCGSDGFTYNSICDLEIVRTVRPNLELHHIGVCYGEGGSLEPFIKLFDNKSELRSRKLSAGKQKKTLSNINLNKQFLSQILQSQTYLNGFNFENNAVNTQGDGNAFKISFNKLRG